MKFITEITQSPNLPTIEWTDRLVTLGSCFSEHIGAKFQNAFWQTEVQAFGTLFNPVSLCRIISLLAEKTGLDESKFISHQEFCYHYDFPHTLYDTSKPTLAKQISQIAQYTRKRIQEATHIFITLGTATVYTYQGEVVANCHKQASVEFKKRTLSFYEISSAIEQLQALLLEINPQLHIIWTISPVRHIKDGLVENQHSKSLLRAAVGELTAKEANYYFPSYELMMDSLRDYRFYNQDLIHPNQTAIDYIWDTLQTWCMPTDTQTYLKQAETIARATSHRVQREGSIAHQQFVSQTNQHIENFNQAYGKQLGLLN